MNVNVTLVMKEQTVRIVSREICDVLTSIQKKSNICIRISDIKYNYLFVKNSFKLSLTFLRHFRY